jgi:hypothetical protein
VVEVRAKNQHDGFHSISRIIRMIFPCFVALINKSRDILPESRQMGASFFLSGGTNSWRFQESYKEMHDQRFESHSA